MTDGIDMNVYREVFLSESAEYLQGIVDALLTLESDPDDLEPVEAVFRAAHSLKGMSGTMGYERTANLTHTMESLMDTVRKREQPVTGDLIDLVLRATDTLRELVNEESSGGSEIDPELMVQELRERTDAAHAGSEAVAQASAPAPAPIATAPEGTVTLRVELDPSCQLAPVRAYMVIKRLRQLGDVTGTEPSEIEIDEGRFDGTFLVHTATVRPGEKLVEAVEAITDVSKASVVGSTPPAPEPQAASASVPEATEPATEAPSPVATSAPDAHGLDRDAAFGRAAKAVPKLADTQTVRIALTHLDTMVDVMGELVIARSRLENIAERLDLRDLSDAVSEVHRISAELQREVMATRMVPVGNIFNRFPRMVRDLARDLGKDVSFEVDGLDIELDRTVLDEIVEPLVHLLRNSIDHGLELSADRVAAGKPERGLVRLSAARERDRALVTVADDGRGMDVERIWNAACERGMVQASQRDEYSEDEILMLTCTPGFSTAAQATKVSGRGVGMDVVREKVEQLGGALTIRSRAGAGTEFVLALPLTLAIIQALLVRSSKQIYAIPLGAVTEVLAYDDLPVETVDLRPVLTLRDGRVVQLDTLDNIVGVDADASSPVRSRNVVLLEWGDAARAVGVDDLVGRQEIVIKPLSGMFAGVTGLSGATVLGDGSVALILDPRALFVTGDGPR
jgi:two-component system, chemotaxis family, sensor kinase CheA